VTHPRIFNPPTPLAVALDTVDSWIESPRISLLSEGPAYLERLKSVATDARIKGAMAHDARVAALCLEHGVRELWSADRDFSRFKGVKVKNPLV
jgi:predicted nucleic acid-binding protein